MKSRNVPGPSGNGFQQIYSSDYHVNKANSHKDSHIGIIKLLYNSCCVVAVAVAVAVAGGGGGGGGGVGGVGSVHRCRAHMTRSALVLESGPHL